MNVPYTFPAAKPMGMDQPYAEGVSETKNKPFAMQMYGGSPSNSPNTPGYNLGTPSPPLTALSSRSLSSNNGGIAPSPLTMPQFSSQNSQMQQQQQQQQQQTGHGNQAQQQQHRQHQNQSQQQHHQQHQLQQLQQRQHQENQQNQAQQFAQNHPQQSGQQQQNFAHFEQQQKRTSPSQGFEYPDSGLDGRHFQENNRANSAHSGLNAGGAPQMGHDRVHQMPHAYSTQDASVQDPQLRHLHHHSSQQQQQQHQQQHIGHNSHHAQMQMEQRGLSNTNSRDPRLQGEMPQEHRSVQPANLHAHTQHGQNTQHVPGGGMQMQHTTLNSGVQSPPIGLDQGSKLGNQTITIISKMVTGTDEDGSKKKRGRPKKLILDPSSNQYIDSSHENFKKLNRLLKQNADVTVKQAHSAMENNLKFDSLNDQEMKQLLESKDRRGRPRKFPVEQTGITIKGVRVNGTIKGKRKESPVPLESEDKVQKKRRGRPKRETGTLA